jgi:hypothetical protein
MEKSIVHYLDHCCNLNKNCVFYLKKYQLINGKYINLLETP